MTRKQSCTFSGMLLFTMLAAGIVCSGQEKKEFPAPKEETAVGAAFAGTWEGTYSSSVVKPTRVVLVFQQRGATVSGTYLSANGAQGVMQGTAQGASAFEGTAKQITPTCTGEFTMKASVNGNELGWTFDGQDCLGTENGKGQAKKRGPALSPK